MKNLQMSQWKQRFRNKGIGFFVFLKELCQYITETVMGKEGIPWQDVPGYRLFLKCF